LACALPLSSSALGAPVDIASLPVQDAPRPPKPQTAPEKISEREKIQGLFVGDRREEQSHGYASVAVFDDAQLAQRWEQDGYNFMLGSKPAKEDRCFVVANSFANGDEGVADRWATFAQRFAEVQSYEGYDKIVAVRAERFVSDAQGHHVDGIDFWVDAQSGGLRQIRATRLNLARVATPTDGLGVFVARTGERTLEVVLSKEPTALDRKLYEGIGVDSQNSLESFGGFSTSMNGTVGQDSIGSGCGHARFEMELQSAEQRDQDLATFGFVRPSRETASVTSTVLIDLEYEQRPKNQKGVENFVPLSQARVRPLAINVGFSRMSADQEPVLSVSYRWSGPEQNVFLTPVLEAIERHQDQLGRQLSFVGS
jgi:hypothetical protein